MVVVEDVRGATLKERAAQKYITLSHVRTPDFLPLPFENYCSYIPPPLHSFRT